ncbi:SGNH/GDSL hydrolase family protein [Burkholderia sp. Bp8984]|uniref:SGNH/GDSL hydrolase family protein n=1 Tax=Burkholderia sp. Bp8984 TaxID=2184549 RepID=UPI001624AD7E|nr:SGNH/GDSL hydrolase family protein [Burkholderia sp. Bp8984]
MAKNFVGAFRFSLAVAVLLACAACGGGGDGAPAVTAVQQRVTLPLTTQPIIHSPTVLIEEDGDSKTYGATLVNGDYVQAPDNMPTYLRTLFNWQVQTLNNGIGHSTALDLLNGTGGFGVPFAQRMAESKAQIVVISFGANDATNRSETPAVFEQTLYQLTMIAQNAGKYVVIEDASPATGVHEGDIATYSLAAIDAAKQMGVPVIDQYNWIGHQPDWQALLSDGLHPTDTGYKMMAQQQYDVLAPIVAALH